MSAFGLGRSWAGDLRRMPARAFAVLGLCLALAAISACARTNGAATVPTPTPSPTPTVLFASDWSHGLSGWQATPGWTLVNGALESSTADGLSVTIPYTPPASGYTVELDLQILSIPQSGGFYSLIVPRSASADGYIAGVYGLLAGTRPYADHPQITTGINPTGDQDRTLGGLSPVADFEPGVGVDIYTIRVTGPPNVPSVSLSVNGHFYVEADSTVTTPLATGPLQLQVSGVQVRITAIKVIA